MTLTLMAATQSVSSMNSLVHDGASLCKVVVLNGSAVYKILSGGKFAASTYEAS